MADSHRQNRPDPASTAQPVDVSGFDRIDAQLRTMKQEIDSLQIAAGDTARPWYAQASVLIAMAALIFSFGTTFYSYNRTKQQDVHNAKVELRDLIQRLNQLPVRDLDLNTKYARRPDLQSAVSGLLNTENTVLVEQALDVIGEIPHEEVSAMEYFAVASSLSLTGEYDRALTLFEQAFDTAQDASEWVAASRGLAAAAFALGDLRRGRANFRQALEVFERFPSRNEYIRVQRMLSLRCDGATPRLTLVSARKGRSISRGRMRRLLRCPLTWLATRTDTPASS